MCCGKRSAKFRKRSHSHHGATRRWLANCQSNTLTMRQLTALLPQ
ncbi:hypothetical protein HBI99_07100 [Aeromonas veronii]|nr:hypothetical protein [Aeromonas veronii]